MRDLLRRVGVVATYAASRLGRRDRSLWVFGNVRGYRDNPRYLAEYLLHHQDGVNACWIARTESEAAAARTAGLEVAMRDSAQASRIQRRAGVAFLSNGFQDVQGEYLAGAYVVDLGHGKGLKRILLDLPEPPNAGRSVGRHALLRLHRWIVERRLARIGLIVAPGSWARDRYLTAYRASPERIRVLGTPRFDVLHGLSPHRHAGDLRADLGVGRSDYLVLWLPTWREAGDAGWLPALDASDLDAALAGTSVTVLVKPHPYSDMDVYEERVPRHPRMRLLPEDEVDVNLLLGEADALITDYSSVAFDYALLNRPIHFFAPDADTYREGGGLYEPFEWLTGGRHHHAWESLLTELRASARGEDAQARAIARGIRDRTGLEDRPGSCERIAAAVCATVGLTLPAPVPRA